VRDADATLDAGYQFDWIDGGGIDVAVLSFAQVDAAGNVNVGRFGNRIPGVGGFVNIAQGAHRVVFVGTLVAGHGQYEIGDGHISVPADGTKKFVQRVEQISFAASSATAIKKPVSYITERAVFELAEGCPLLTEIAPGVDLRADVFEHMGFVPKVHPKLRTMDKAIFTDKALALTLRKGAGR
jgi:propionate CoA-transferase